MTRPDAPPKPSAPALTRLPFILLALMTAVTIAGPVAIFVTLRAGAHPGWPPDRPVEWWTFGAFTAAEVVLMSACVLIGLLRWLRTPPGGPPGGPGR
jgi:hypothetical protein